MEFAERKYGRKDEGGPELDLFGHQGSLNNIERENEHTNQEETVIFEESEIIENQGLNIKVEQQHPNDSPKQEKSERNQNELTLRETDQNVLTLQKLEQDISNIEKHLVSLPTQISDEQQIQDLFKRDKNYQIPAEIKDEQQLDGEEQKSQTNSDIPNNDQKSVKSGEEIFSLKCPECNFETSVAVLAIHKL